MSKKVAELQRFLRGRNVPVEGNEGHAELEEKAFWAEKLGLPVRLTDREHEQEIEKSKREKLVLDSGMVLLPRPETFGRLGRWAFKPS